MEVFRMSTQLNAITSPQHHWRLSRQLATRRSCTSSVHEVSSMPKHILGVDLGVPAQEHAIGAEQDMWSGSDRQVMMCKKFGIALPPSLVSKNNAWTHEWGESFDFQKELVETYDMFSKNFGYAPIPWDDLPEDSDAPAWEANNPEYAHNGAIGESDVVFEDDKDFYVPADFSTGAELQHELTELKKGNSGCIEASSYTGEEGRLEGEA